MKRKEEILQELSSISPVVADVPFRPTFSVPDEYFDQVSAQFLVHTAGRTNAFSVPENYFDHLPIQIVQKTASTTGQQMPYTIPDNYFETVEVQILDKIKGAQKSGTVVRLFTRWSMAAAITGLLGWGLISYNQWFSDDSALSAELAEAQKIIQQQSFEKEMDALDETTMLDYLNQTGHDVSSALVASLTNEDHNLPNVEDYILDESTLNNYLETTNLTEFNHINN